MRQKSGRRGGPELLPEMIDEDLAGREFTELRRVQALAIDRGSISRRRV